MPQLTPIDPTQKPIELTNAQMDDLNKRWDALFTPAFRRRDMVLTEEGSSERKASLRVLISSLGR